MWTQITCLANDEQSIPQRSIATSMLRVTRFTSLGSICTFPEAGGLTSLFERRKRDRREKLYHSGVVTRLTAQEAVKHSQEKFLDDLRA
jgi:hypothetical protein